MRKACKTNDPGELSRHLGRTTLAEHLVLFRDRDLLHSLCRNGSVDCLRLLRDRCGADLDIEDFDGHRLVHTAAQHDQVACLRFLHQAGVDCGARTVPGDRTPLEIATDAGAHAACAFLESIQPAQTGFPRSDEAPVPTPETSAQGLKVFQWLVQDGGETAWRSMRTRLKHDQGMDLGPLEKCRRVIEAFAARRGLALRVRWRGGDHHVAVVSASGPDDHPCPGRAGGPQARGPRSGDVTASALREILGLARARGGIIAWRDACRQVLGDEGVALAPYRQALGSAAAAAMLELRIDGRDSAPILVVVEDLTRVASVVVDLLTAARHAVWWTDVSEIFRTYHHRPLPGFEACRGALERRVGGRRGFFWAWGWHRGREDVRVQFVPGADGAQ